MLINKIKLTKDNILDGTISIPLSTNFSPETQKYEDIEKIFNLRTSNIVNDIVDYEKIKIQPIGSTGITTAFENETELPIQYADGVNFKLHFINTGETNGWDTGSTKITSIGFTEDDIKNRKKKLNNSFIRLSFYDSNNLKTQNLLYYATIFLDGDTMYSNYINSGLQTTGLTSEFLTQNPALSKKIKSFEGFNVYLFKGDISKTEITTIYVRVDFNNASNGISTLFTNNKPMDVDGFEIEELSENLFIKTFIVFDKKNSKYYYYFDGENPENSSTDDIYVKKILNIDLYQAKVK